MMEIDGKVVLVSKKLFQPVNSMHSTHLLVEKHNKSENTQKIKIVNIVPSAP